MRALVGVLVLTLLLTLAVPGIVRSQQRAEIVIQDFEFRPADLRLNPTGGKVEVRWVNNGPTTHQVVADGGAFDSRPLARGAAFSFTFTNAGTFGYHCQIHPAMKGQVVVEQPDMGEPGGY